MQLEEKEKEPDTKQVDLGKMVREKKNSTGLPSPLGKSQISKPHFLEMVEEMRNMMEKLQNREIKRTFKQKESKLG